MITYFSTSRIIKKKSKKKIFKLSPSPNSCNPLYFPTTHIKELKKKMLNVKL